MIKAATKRDIFWGYLAQGLNIGAGVILLPIIIHFLSPADVGLWFVFVTLASLAQLLEFGFQPTIARNVAYVYAGARELSSSSIPSETGNAQEPDVKLLASVFRSARRIYAIVAGVACIVLLGGGSLYVDSLLASTQNEIAALSGWIAFSLGYIITFYYGYFNSFLLGRGDVLLSNKVLVITRAAFILLGGLAVVAGFGLLGLGMASLFAAGFGRWAAHSFYARNALLKFADIKGYLPSDRKILRDLWHNASRLGIVQLGSFLILRGNILIASSKLGLEVTASYSMTVTIFLAMSSVAMVICQSQVPYMSSLQAKRDINELRGVYGQILLLAWGVYFAGFVVILFFGKLLLPLISKGTALLPWPILFTMGIIQLLELNHSIAATYLTTINKVPFWTASICSGAAILMLGFIAVGWFGIWAPVISQGIVQLVYNNWKWPLEALRDLNINASRVLVSGYVRLVK